MFLTLWFTLLWVSGSSYYQHYTVSVCYQPYFSFWQNARELKAGRITYEDKGRRETAQGWQKLALEGLNWAEEVHFSTWTRSSSVTTKQKPVTFRHESGTCILYFSFLLQFRSRWMSTWDVGLIGLSALEAWFPRETLTVLLPSLVLN